MNIKYKFNTNEKVSQPLTPIGLFLTDNVPWEGMTPEKPNGGLYPWDPSSTIKPAYIFSKNIELINQRISQITKQLTYWDLYKLVSQVKEPSTLNSIYAALIPGQACVINCNSFTDNNQDYHRGDIVVKMLDGEAAYIPAIASGFYLPDKDESGYDETGNFKLIFKYSQDKAESPISIVLNKEEQGQIEKSYVYGIFVSKPEDGFGDRYEFNNIVYTWIEDDEEKSKIIRPLIKFFTAEQEEIAIDFQATLSDYTDKDHPGKWTIIWNSLPSDIEYIQIK